MNATGHAAELPRRRSAVRAQEAALSWRRVIAALIVVIFFIPIRRYTLARTGFELEPYRILVALMIFGWFGVLLTDARTRLRRSGFEGPLALIGISILGSIALNADSIAAQGVSSDVLKSVTFFSSFFMVFYLILSVLRRQQEIDTLVKVMVVCASAVALLSVVEWRTGYNVFNHLHSVFPLLQLNFVPNPAADITGFTRGGRLRVFASAEHPIELSAALLMIVPLGVYLALKTRRWFWWLAVAALGLGAMATVSRTGVVMMVVITIVYVWLRPRQTIRLWPAIFPVLVLVHFALPNTLGILKGSLFPKGGLKTLAEEQGNTPGAQTGRIAKIGPTLQQVGGDPLFGVGFGSQVLNQASNAAAGQTGQGQATNPDGTLANVSINWTGTPPPRVRILDDQWLGTLLETGFVGVLAWIWLFGRFIRRLGRAAKKDRSDRGWLLVGLTASIAAFAVSMLLYDAFAFIQAVFVFFILLGFGAFLLLKDAEAQDARDR